MENNIEMTILNIIEKNSRISLEDIAAMTGKTVLETGEILQKMADDEVICGYTTLINWDKTDKEFVTALIEVCVSPQSGIGYDKIAKKIYSYDEVKAVYLMAGVFDLTVIVEGKNIKEVSMFASDKLARLDEVSKAATHFVLKKYKDNGVVFEKNTNKDERMIISP